MRLRIQNLQLMKDRAQIEFSAKNLTTPVFMSFAGKI
jgi:hypothetical protein